MERTSNPPLAGVVEPRSQPAPDLLRSLQALRNEVKHLTQENEELTRQLGKAVAASQVDRESRLAALNLMEDAIEARRQLQRETEERRTAETQLRELNVGLDQRVQERTRELSDSEQSLQRVAATARDQSLRLRELSVELAAAEQRERRRLANVLHDHVQQLLVAVRLRIDMVKDFSADEKTAGQLDGALTILDQAIHATRTLSVELAPPLLHDQGLPAALRWLAPHMEELHGLSVTLDLDESANPDTEEHRDILFAAGREFILNAVKHAGTKSLTLRLRHCERQFWLEVADKGVGFDASSLEKAQGSFGLFHLRQRLEAIGGSLSVESTPHQGTRVAATITVQGS